MRDLTSADSTWKHVVTGFEKQFDVIDNDGGQLLVLTNAGAPNRRVVRIDPGTPAESNWKTVIPEQKEVLEEIYEETGEDIFVASYSAVQDSKSGIVRTYCVWSEGVEALLPRTDEVFFVRGVENEEVGIEHIERKADDRPMREQQNALQDVVEPDRGAGPDQRIAAGDGEALRLDRRAPRISPGSGIPLLPCGAATG